MHQCHQGGCKQRAKCTGGGPSVTFDLRQSQRLPSLARPWRLRRGSFASRRLCGCLAWSGARWRSINRKINDTGLGMLDSAGKTNSTRPPLPSPPPPPPPLPPPPPSRCLCPGERGMMGREGRMTEEVEEDEEEEEEDVSTRGREED